MNSAGSASGAKALPPWRGASAALVSRVLAKVIGLGFIVILAREISVEDFASYSYLLVLASTVALLTDAGVALVAGRDVARGEVALADAYRSGLLPIAGTALLASVGVAAVGSVDAGPGSGGWALAWTAVFIGVTGFFNFQAELLRASGRPWIEAALQMVSAVTMVGAGLYVIRSDGGLAALMAVLALKQLIVVLLTQCWLPSPHRGSANAELTRAFLKQGLWLTGATTGLAVLLRVSQIALGNLVEPAVLAEYVVAVRYLEVTVVICQTAGFGLLPSLASHAVRDPQSFRRVVRKMIVTGTLGAVAVTVIAMAFTPWLTTTLFGDRYRDAGRLALVFVAQLPIVCAFFLAWYALVAERRERDLLKAASAGAVAALAGCVLIVLSPTGPVAALSTGVALLVATAVSVAMVLGGGVAQVATPAQLESRATTWP